MSDYNPKENSSSQPEQQGSSTPAGGSPPPGDAPAQPGQYWSGQDARRAQGGAYGSRYNGQYHRPYEPYSQPRQGQQQGPYQYNAGGGWQPPRQDPHYEWNFEDYDRFAGQKKKKKSRGLVVFAVSVLGVLFVALVGLSGLSIYNNLTRVPEDAPGVETSAPEGAYEEEEAAPPAVSGNPDTKLELTNKPFVPDPEAAPNGKLTIPQVAKKLLPSVVSVENYQNGQIWEAASLGSGIIMNEEGYIITNQHVVASADALKVTLDSGDPYEAVIIGSDRRTDLALIKIEATGLIPAEFGDSSQLDVGETVIAIGNPASLELKGSVTQGIVSAVNRKVHSGDYDMTYIQTDAAINPGNSGGALVNEFGQVVGINSSKIVQEGFEGIGFAIPISDAKPIIDDLMTHGRVRGRVMLGITAQPVDEITARNYNIPTGLIIREIQQGSDLQLKGVQVRDIITHVDGERVHTFSDLRAVLDRFQVGSQVRLTLFRQSSVTQGTNFDVTITLMEDEG